MFDSPATPLLVTWPHVAVFCAAVLVALFPEWQLFRRRHREPPPGPADRGSRLVIIVVNETCLLLAVAAAMATTATRLQSAQPVFFWSGIACMFVGGILRTHCMHVLGSHFTSAVAVQPDQGVVERGAYRWVRHPSYTGGILTFVGLGLALANWLSLVVLLAGPLVAYSYRAHVEEAYLLARLGPAYASYMHRTKRFLPFLF